MKSSEETAYLVLEDGTVFPGKRFGAAGDVTGEVVFTTGMTGYLETLTDSSYYGQLIVQTFPLIGNYGVIPEDFESQRVKAKAYIVKSWCADPSNFRSEGDIDAFLKEQGVVGLCGVDTRALTCRIRRQGVMNGRICADSRDADAADIQRYRVEGAVEAVSVKRPRYLGPEGAKYTVALMDYGVKEGIVQALTARGCGIWVFPHDSRTWDIMPVRPDGIVLSNGPGDPMDNNIAVENLKYIANTGPPVFGVCLGHQLLALSQGFRTQKLKFGHRGANQPAKDLATGRVYITSQNHGYAVASDSVDVLWARESFANMNDHTCEGLEYLKLPAFTVQFHPEAHGGPRDTLFLFDRFTAMMEEYQNAIR